MSRFELAPLVATHDRAAFNSDSEPLNRYLREQVAQDVRRRVAACFVALADEKRLAGYYTLASASLLLADLPASTGKKLPRYPTVPAVRMGRLAVDQAFKGLGLGGSSSFLPASWLHRSARLAAHPVLATGNHPTFSQLAVLSKASRRPSFARSQTPALTYFKFRFLRRPQVARSLKVGRSTLYRPL